MRKSSPPLEGRCSRLKARPPENSPLVRSHCEVIHRVPLFYCSNCSSVPELKCALIQLLSAFAGGEIGGAGGEIGHPGGEIGGAGGKFSQLFTSLCGGRIQRCGGQIQQSICDD